MTHGGSRARRAIELILALAVFVAILLWMFGLLHEKVSPGDRRAEGKGGPITAPTLTVAFTTIPAMEEEIGTVESREEVEVASRLLAVIREVRVDMGDRVKKGQTLATLVSQELEHQVLQARGQVIASAAREAQAERDAARMERLYAAGVVSRADLERVQTELMLSRAGETVARGALGAAREVAAFRTVTAPLDGVVSQRLVDPGDMAAPGRTLFVLHDAAHYRLVATLRGRIPDTALVVGDSVSVHIDEIDRDLVGRVAEIQPALDPRSRVMTVKVDLPEGSGVKSGMFGRLRFAVGRRPAILLPRSAVMRTGTLEMVKTVSPDGTRAETRYVKLGDETDSGQVEVLSGLAPGDRVLIEAQ